METEHVQKGEKLADEHKQEEAALQEEICY
jgi:hypothetical protein